MHATTTAVTATKGTITGSYVLGESLTFQCAAGKVDNVQVTVNTDVSDTGGSLTSNVTMGSTTITVLTPLGSRNKIASKHTTDSGSITLQYPTAWEGVMNAKTDSGSVKTSGVTVTSSTTSGTFERLQRRHYVSQSRD